MRATDLDLRELLDFESIGGGVIPFAGPRAILTKFGYAHCYRTAETLRPLPWSSEAEWRTAGGRLHTLQGLVTVEPVLHSEGPNPPFAEAIWRDSYEAEQHLLHLGRADEAVCWTLCGFASGYLSSANGRDIYCLEESCVGKGDAVC